jgi:hypothetical protein
MAAAVVARRSRRMIACRTRCKTSGTGSLVIHSPGNVTGASLRGFSALGTLRDRGNIP